VNGRWIQEYAKAGQVKQMKPIDQLTDFPEDFRKCVRFHGHLCPGLALGYAAVNAARTVLAEGHAVDEELVTVVENDSCAVDAIQVLLGCTFGKGNLIFRDWGKQVFTFMARNTGASMRVSFKGPMPFSLERRGLKGLIESGQASEEDKEKWALLRREASLKLLSCDPREFFNVREIHVEFPPKARVVTTVPCDACGEATVQSRMVEQNGKLLCRECAGSSDWDREPDQEIE
jgi:formylmethanofuran dehydrogenase subunit E